jgi:hypothetical protein
MPASSGLADRDCFVVGAGRIHGRNRVAQNDGARSEGRNIHRLRAHVVGRGQRDPFVGPHDVHAGRVDPANRLLRPQAASFQGLSFRGFEVSRLVRNKKAVGRDRQGLGVRSFRIVCQLSSRAVGDQRNDRCIELLHGRCRGTGDPLPRMSDKKEGGGRGQCGGSARQEQP